MKRQMLMIVNPISGSGIDKLDYTRRITEYLANEGIETTVRMTEYAGHATALAHDAVKSGRFEAVLPFGGDGTINETAKALLHTGVAMGIIPAGSGNGLARHIGLPVDPVKALDTIVQGAYEDCDCGSVNGRYFFCTFGVGYDAAIAERFANSGQRGKMTYIKSAVEEFFKFSHFKYRLHANGQTTDGEAFMMTVCNASQFGNNAYIAPSASITDGMLDLTVIKKSTPIETAMLTVDLTAGTIDRNRLITGTSFTDMIIERANPGPAHLDGEPVTMGCVLSVKCHTGALRLIVPEGRGKFRPLITPAEDLLRDAGQRLQKILG